MMKTIALIWELGTDLGHLVPLVPIVRQLQHAGYRPVLIVRDVSKMEVVFKGLGVDYLQAPIWLPQRKNSNPTQINYTDTLFNVGFLDPQGLTAMVKSWLQLFKQVKPDLLLFDHSPTALLASKMLKLPKIVLGNGFAVPPQQAPIPPYLFWQNQRDLQPRLEREEALCVGVINRVLAYFSQAPIRAVHDIYQADHCFITTDPALDIYEKRDYVEYLGTLSTEQIGEEKIIWPLADQWPKVFAYLKPEYKYLDVLLRGLGQSGAQYIIYAPGIDQQKKQHYQTQNIVFAPSIFNINKLRQVCDAAIIHGGSNLRDKFLEAGKPLLLLPMHIENLMLSKVVEREGAGLCFHSDHRPEQLMVFINQLVTSQQLQAKAQQLSQRMLKLTQQEQLSKIINQITRLVEYS